MPRSACQFKQIKMESFWQNWLLHDHRVFSEQEAALLTLTECTEHRTAQPLTRCQAVLQLHLAGNHNIPGKGSQLEFSSLRFGDPMPLQLSFVFNSFAPRVSRARNSLHTSAAAKKPKGIRTGVEKIHLCSDPAKTCTGTERETGAKSKNHASKNDVQRRKEATTPFQRCCEGVKDSV